VNGFTKVTAALQYLKMLSYKLKALFYSAICIEFVTYSLHSLRATKSYRFIRMFMNKMCNKVNLTAGGCGS